jgi:hypothetical protein
MIELDRVVDAFLPTNPMKNKAKKKKNPTNTFSLLDWANFLPLSVFGPDGEELLQGHVQVLRRLVDEVRVAAGVGRVAEAGAHRVVDVQQAGVAVPANEGGRSPSFVLAGGLFATLRPHKGFVAKEEEEESLCFPPPPPPPPPILCMQIGSPLSLILTLSLPPSLSLSLSLTLRLNSPRVWVPLRPRLGRAFVHESANGAVLLKEAEQGGGAGAALHIQGGGGGKVE